MDIFPPAAQRPALIEFAKALGSAPRALRTDECGDPVIEGQHGHIYAVCGSLDEPGRPGWQFFVFCKTGMAWTYAQKALKFAGEPTNDGDTEGAFIMHRLPSKSEAETIRRYCGIPKRVEYNAADLERRRAWARQTAEARQFA